MTYFETIKQRRSVRSYSGQALEPIVIDKLELMCENQVAGPFNSKVRFKLLNIENAGPKQLRKLGTYGVIRGAKIFIIGIIEESKQAREDLGYCMEKIILEATRLGLGTCWLAGTFKRSAFTREANIVSKEYIPAITPVGYHSDNLSTTASIISLSARSKKRKPFSKLFFEADGKKALTENDAGKYRIPLEAVRLGPSATNRQPWRILREDQNIFHLFLKENIVYKSVANKLNVQRLDMGIAMCHFELAAKEQGQDGRWSKITDKPNIPGLKYIATWIK